MQPLGALALHCGNARTAIFFTAFSEKLEEQPDVLSAWICAMEHAQAQDAGFASLESEELTAMQEYAAALGESGYSAQEKNALLLEKRLEEIAKRAAEVYRQKGRMYRSMGILSGMAAAILLL